MRKINKLNCLVLKKEICRNAICNHNVDCREFGVEIHIIQIT